MSHLAKHFNRCIFMMSLLLSMVSSQVVQAQNSMTQSESASILHLNVANLERSLEFYRGVLGMEFVDPPAEPRSGRGLVDDANVMLQTTILKTPNGSFSLELVEWLNTPLRAMYPNIQDPGEIMLAMTVRDLDALLARAREIGLQVLSENGAAYDAPTNRAVMIRDSDGFIVELVERKDRDFTGPGEVSDVSVWLSVADLNQTVTFYNNVFGFDLAEPGPAGAANDRIQALFGDRSIATMRASRGTFPGSDFEINFQEFTGPTRRPVAHRVQDPGGPIMLIGVNDFSAAIDKIKQYDGLVGTDQKSVMLDPGTSSSWTRDPNGLLIRLSQEQ
tara:strand:- start:58658 stop:59653 length:996 start_codon:yes stop_codon:yes gene_type:complete